MLGDFAGTPGTAQPFYEIMVASRSLDDLHYYRDRAEHCRKAAEEATDASARIAHLQLAKFYETRLASALENAGLQADTRASGRS